jgi:hypothetical protein
MKVSQKARFELMFSENIGNFKWEKGVVQQARLVMRSAV